MKSRFWSYAPFTFLLTLVLLLLAVEYAPALAETKRNVELLQLAGSIPAEYRDAFAPIDYDDPSFERTLFATALAAANDDCARWREAEAVRITQPPGDPWFPTEMELEVRYRSARLQRMAEPYNEFMADFRESSPDAKAYPASLPDMRTFCE